MNDAGVAHEKKMTEMGCTDEKVRDKLLLHLARRMGYKGNKKVAEHGICKTYRTADGWDVYFMGQSLFNVKVDEKGNVTGLKEKKYGSDEWEDYVPEIYR